MSLKNDVLDYLKVLQEIETLERELQQSKDLKNSLYQKLSKEIGDGCVDLGDGRVAIYDWGNCRIGVKLMVEEKA